MIITGTLKFWPQPGCEVTNTCNVALILDSGSQIVVPDSPHIIHEGPGVKKEIYIGGLVLDPGGMPFGPGILPEDAPLPVALSTFYGKAMNNTVVLEWQTASEENTESFILERSVDGRNDFIEIGNVEAKGFSNETQNYKFEDRAPLEMAYYRLKVMDFDVHLNIRISLLLKNQSKRFLILRYIQFLFKVN